MGVGGYGRYGIPGAGLLLDLGKYGSDNGSMNHSLLDSKKSRHSLKFENIQSFSHA